MIIKAALRSLRPEAPAADIREAVKDIDEEVDRLNRIVHDVLDFAKPPSMLREPADLVRLCQDAAAAATVGGGPAIDLDDARRAAGGLDRSRAAAHGAGQRAVERAAGRRRARERRRRGR